jgi:hypothetical protein
MTSEVSPRLGSFDVGFESLIALALSVGKYFLLQ